MPAPSSLTLLTESDPPVRCEDPPGGPRTPLVFASPHSGRGAPAAFLSLLRAAPASLRRAEDAFVDALFAPAPSLGAPLVAAEFCRTYVDANREPAEIDPAMISEPAPAWANSGSPRVANGLGVTPRLTVDGETIHRRLLSLAEVEARIAGFHAPYHAALSSRLERARGRFGFAVLIDCHSMPSAPDGRPAPDIVLGDRYGASCDPRLTETVERALAGRGFSVQRNTPYAGGYTTAHYGRPRTGVHALQIELSRGLYLDERAVRPLPGAFESLAARLESFIAEMTARDWSVLDRGRGGAAALKAAE